MPTLARYVRSAMSPHQYHEFVKKLTAEQTSAPNTRLAQPTSLTKSPSTRLKLTRFRRNNRQLDYRLLLLHDAQIEGAKIHGAQTTASVVDSLDPRTTPPSMLLLEVDLNQDIEETEAISFIGALARAPAKPPGQFK